jgi:uncharacterized SAM-binding protein YcdF (DUF218 family)
VAEAGWFLFSAGGAVSVMGGAAIWVWRRPASRPARAWLLASALFYGLASSHVVGSALRSGIGDGFVPFERTAVGAGPTAVVILGSGGFTVRGWDGTPLSVLDTWAAGRVLEAARVFALVDPAWVIVSGGLPDRHGRDESTDLMMQRALVELGVPASRIRGGTRSRDTRAEAATIAPILRSLGVAHTVLVTSRVHMRRAVGAFRAQGVRVVAAPAPDRDLRPAGPMRFVPTAAGLSDTAMAAHELAGIAYYAMRGWYQGDR